MSCISIYVYGNAVSVGGAVAIANVHLVQQTSCFKMLSNIIGEAAPLVKTPLDA